MRRILIIGASLGLTGCKIIQLQEASIMLTKVGLDLIEAIEGFKRVAQKSIIEKQDFRSVKAKVATAWEPWDQSHQPIKEKKPKYIRQQHKLAQRHYRRK